MPGIVGLITQLPRPEAEPILLRMVESMKHEAFYVTGTWIDEQAGVYVGWVARRGSFAAGMPLCNKRGDVVLIFSGEEYAEPEVKHRFLQQDGCSYLVGLYEESKN